MPSKVNTLEIADDLIADLAELSVKFENMERDLDQGPDLNNQELRFLYALGLTIKLLDTSLYLLENSVDS